MVTTPGHNNCLPGEAMHTEKNTMFISYSTELTFKILHHQTFDSNTKSNQGRLWSTLTCVTFPVLTTGSILVHQKEAGVDMQSNLL